jgi:hypothetical protein
MPPASGPWTLRRRTITAATEPKLNAFWQVAHKRTCLHQARGIRGTRHTVRKDEGLFLLSLRIPIDLTIRLSGVLPHLRIVPCGMTWEPRDVDRGPIPLHPWLLLDCEAKARHRDRVGRKTTRDVKCIGQWKYRMGRSLETPGVVAVGMHGAGFASRVVHPYRRLTASIQMEFWGRRF